MTLPSDDSAARNGGPPVSLSNALADRYEFVRELGRGGMATVYLARDRKHGREVAIKLLDPELGAVLGAERFLSEIRTTATLQHPNLLPLFDSGEVDGLLYYVMPYITGETLRARLQREKQLPVDEVVRLTVAVASALEYAHGRGVIHRDLKPENILLQAGQPVVADFGIALAVSNAGGARVTQTGLSLGTPQYMSPEQAMGDRVLDARSDVYALGAVCYEMLTGEPPHVGATAQAIMARLLTEVPRAPREVRPAVPAHVDGAVRRALEKLPADRFSAARQFAEAIEGRGTVAVESPARVERPRGLVSRVLSSPVWAVVCVVAAAVAVWFMRKPQPQPMVARFAIPTTEAERLALYDVRTLAISPDGQTIAYIAATATNGVLYIRKLDDLKPRLIAGSDGVRSPFFSPDGKWVGFIARGRLRKVSVDGGAIADITDGTVIPDFSGGVVWTPSGDILFHSANDTAFAKAGLLRVSSGGGVVTAYTRRVKDVEQNSPLVAMDGKTVLVSTVAGRLGVTAVGAGSTGLGFVEADSSVTILPLAVDRLLGFIDDRLIFLRPDGSVMGAGVDINARKLTGEPELLVETVRTVALSASGTLVYAAGQAANTPVLVDQLGTSTPIVNEARAYAHPRFSPDGKRIAFDVGGPQGRAIFVYEIASSTLTRLTNSGSNVRPEWTPDGSRILYRQVSPGRGLWWQPADGGGAPEQLIEVPGGPNEGMVTSDGRTLLFRTDEGNGDQQVFTVPLDKSAKPALFLGKSVNWAPRFSPDAKWIAYSSDESGVSEVYVRPWPGSGGRVQISNNGGSEPVWSRDGRTLYYRQDGTVMAVAINTNGQFAVLSRRQLFNGPYEVSGPHASYDVAPDGKRLLMLQTKDDSSPMLIVLNWASEVRARLSSR